MPKSGLHYFGIRHHGPGSAKRLIAALDTLQPVKILIEGPADCSELMPMLAHSQMKPPVALLAYSADLPSNNIYYPFAEFSPEYQACLWAIKNHAELQFIDLPISIQLTQHAEKINKKNEDESFTEETEPEHLSEKPNVDSQEALNPIYLDPIGTLAKLAGYEDGEAWWNDLIEHNSDNDTEIFSTIEQAMATLREGLDENNNSAAVLRNLQREAYMRLEIAKASKDIDDNIAVVCGAWHVPALKAKSTIKADKALLQDLPSKLGKSKVKATWIPWTMPRLSTSSGYRAGVDAPMWYQHLWLHRSSDLLLETWLSQVSKSLRDSGQIVSTASSIEALRLSKSLATVRRRPNPGFEEIRESVVACLCFGEPLIWQQVEEQLLLGNAVGSIPDHTPLAPLLEDLQRLQKKSKLKPEALKREVSLDLRSDTGLAKSILLHRLTILGVTWGQLSSSGNSRGTFREKWILEWLPEYAVTLVENLVYGSTIEQAASNKLTETLKRENSLGKLAEIIQQSLESQLHNAAETGLERLSDRATHTSDALELLDSIAPLVQIQRYGNAREISLEHIEELTQRLAVQAALALPYACRNLNEEEASRYRNSITKAHQALLLAELDDNIMEDWWQALHEVINSSLSSLLVVGLCTRLLYQATKINSETLQTLLQRALSPALPSADAARFFEGFFTDSVQQLLYDQILIEALENWLIQIDEEAFIEFLPLFRRVFSDLDPMERKRLVDTVLSGRSSPQKNKTVNNHLLPLWSEHLKVIGLLVQRDKAWKQ